MKDNESNSLGEQQLKQQAVKALAVRLDDIIEEWEIQNNITEKHYDDLLKQHFRISKTL